MMSNVPTLSLPLNDLTYVEVDKTFIPRMVADVFKKSRKPTDVAHRVPLDPDFYQNCRAIFDKHLVRGANDYVSHVLFSNLAIAGSDLNFTRQNIYYLDNIVTPNTKDYYSIPVTSFFFAEEMYQVLTAIGNSHRLYDITGTVKELANTTIDANLSYPDVYEALTAIISHRKYVGRTLDTVYHEENGLPLKNAVISEYTALKTFLNTYIFNKPAYTTYVTLTYYNTLRGYVTYEKLLHAVETNPHTLYPNVEAGNFSKGLNYISHMLNLD